MTAEIFDCGERRAVPLCQAGGRRPMPVRGVIRPPKLWLAERQEIRVTKVGETSRPTRIAVAPLSKARGHAPR